MRKDLSATKLLQDPTKHIKRPSAPLNDDRIQLTLAELHIVRSSSLIQSPRL